MKKDNKTFILGAGLTGLSTAYHLKGNYEIFEKDSRPGGLCKSEKEKGFIFDYTGHLIHLENKYIEKLVKDLLKQNLHFQDRKSWIYSKGVYTPYPFQANTYGLPPYVIKACIIGLIKAKYEQKSQEIKSFEDWIMQCFGEGIAKHFMIPYNQKLWRVHPKEMTAEWIGRFIPEPNIEEFLDGALERQNKKFGYNAQFWYPLKGGIESLVEAFAERIDNKINLNKKATEIFSEDKEVIFNDEDNIKYDKLVSTIPLPELVNLIDTVPENVKFAANNLKYTSALNVNIGVNRLITDKHWIYVPEKDFIFYRVGFYSNISPYLCPQNTTSIYTEISYNKENPRPIDKEEELIDRVINDLIKLKILRKEDEIIATKILDIKYAYVIYNHNYSKNFKIIHDFLDKHDIYSIGRYGGWKYSTMEDAILDGKRVADKINAERESINDKE